MTRSLLRDIVLVHKYSPFKIMARRGKTKTNFGFRLLDLINVSAFLLLPHAGGTKIIAPKLLFASDAEPVFCLRGRSLKRHRKVTLSLAGGVWQSLCFVFGRCARPDAACGFCGPKLISSLLSRDHFLWLC